MAQGNQANVPFFIIGPGRSGTTLLRLILAGHSRLHIPPETWFILQLVKRLPLTTVLTPAEVSIAISVITGDYRWPDMEIAAQDFSQWALALDHPKLVDILNLIYQRHLEVAHKLRFGDKTPTYFAIVPQLAQLYPGAKFIYMMRDGRDVAISRLRLDWDRYYERNFEWAAAVRCRQAYSTTPYSPLILDVRYEDLVTNTEGSIRKICEFLDEKFEPQMLDFHKVLELVPSRERGIHQRLAQPISTDATNIWTKQLSAVECFMMEACLYKGLVRSGYRLRYAAPAWRPLLASAGGLLRSAAPVLRRGVPYLRRRRLFPKNFCL
jgi:hypothetical protein